MRKLLFLVAAAAALFAASCSKYDDSALSNRVDNLESRVAALEALCKQMNTNISSLQTIVEALQNADYITSVTPVTQNGVTIGYTITFAKNGSITIYHGTDGKDGQNGKDGADGQNGKDGKDGYTPVIGVRQDADGLYYWTLDGEWLLDAGGNKICAVGRDGCDGVDGQPGKDGADGQDGKNGVDGKDGVDGQPGKDGADGRDGKDGITPQLKIEDGYWFISYDNGTTWTQLGKATGEDGKDGTNGKDGADGKDGVDGLPGQPGANGDSMFRSVTQDELNVYLTLADGTVITIPKGAPLSIAFDEEDLVVMAPNSTREIHYTVSSVIPDVEIEVVSSADIKAKVVAASATTGAIEVKTSATIDEYSKVVVFVSNGEKVIMRRFVFEQTGLQVEDNATKEAAAEGGELVLEFMSNVECEVVIPESAQSWISVVPQTRAMEKRSITLKLEPNEGHNRSATVTVQSLDGSVKLEYFVEQEGNMGAIDPEAVPDNEIWYRAIDNKPIVLSNNDICDASLIENQYINGLGKLVFNNSISLVKQDAFCAISTLSEIILPSNIKVLKSGAFRQCVNLKQVNIRGNLSSVEPLAFWDCPLLEKFVSPNATEDGRYIIIDNILTAVAGYRLTNVTIPANVERVGESAFKACLDIKEVTIPSNVKYLDNGAFSNCSNLATLSLSEGLINIGSDFSKVSSTYELGDTFAYTAITEVTLPQSLEVVDSWSFRGCKNIKGFYGNDRFHSADNKCLYANFTCGAPLYGIYIGKFVGYDLTSYIIPDGVWAIENYAFENLPLLTEVTFPNTLKVLGYDAFFNCPNLRKVNGEMVSEDGRGVIIDNCYLAYVARADAKKIHIQNGVESIGECAFAHNWDYTAEGFNSGTPLCVLDEITMSDDVKSIGNEAFAWCKTLKSITLSANLQNIASMDIIANSYELTEIYLRASVPPQIVNPQSSFQFDNAKLTIYVPIESLTLYNDSPDWYPYKSFIKGYNYTDLPDVGYYYSTDYSQDGKVVTLQKSTKGNGVDVVLMGDAYSDRQIADGTYMKAMQTMADNLFSEEPYKSFKDMFNVYVVNVVSATEGYEYGNTALNGFFGGGTYVGGNDALCFQYALNAISEERMDEALIVVAMNEDAYAGTCFMYYPTTVTGTYGSGPSVAYFPTSSDTATLSGLVLHEAGGHGFSKLADEYDYGTTVSAEEVNATKTQQNDWGWWKNVDFTGDPSAVRWNYFLSDYRYANDGLGVFEGGLTHSFGVWRPTDNSIMRYNYGGFNAPSREAIYYRIHKLAYGDSWQYNYEDFVKYDEINRKAAASARVYAPSTYKPTHPPVVVNKSWRDAK